MYKAHIAGASFETPHVLEAARAVARAGGVSCVTADGCRAVAHVEHGRVVLDNPTASERFTLNNDS